MEKKTLSIFTLIMISALLGFGSVNIVFAKTVDPPRIQLEKGVAPEDIICKPGLVLVIFTDAPMCLKPSTVSKLEQRGVPLIRGQVQQENHIDTIPEFTSKNKTGATIQGHTGKPQTPFESVTSSRGGIVNFYINDNDLNTSPDGVDVIQTKGLLVFTVNGIPIKGPTAMIETGKSTGKFFIRLELPDSVNGIALTQDDVVEIKYLDQADEAGAKRTSVASVPLTQTFAQLETSGSGQTRIGHEFVVRIYEEDMNLDSREVDTIPLSSIVYRGEGGIRTTLSNPVFDANGSYLLETGENSGIFEVVIKIPRTINGITVNIGDWYEIRYIDSSTPSETTEEIKLRGKIG